MKSKNELWFGQSFSSKKNRVEVSLLYDSQRGELTSHFNVKIICKLYLKKQHYVKQHILVLIWQIKTVTTYQKINICTVLVMFIYIGKTRNHQRIVGKNINKDTFTSYLLNRYHKCPSGPWFDMHVMFHNASIAILSQNVTHDIFVLLIIS